LPLIHALRQEGMRERHWKTISDNLNLSIQPSAEFTLKKALEMGLLHHLDVIQEVSELASKEFGIEMALKKMQEEWIPLEMQVIIIILILFL